MTIDNGILKPSGMIQLRGGTYEAMNSVNPLLARREIAVEIDTGKIKVGDGENYWNDLDYVGSSFDLPPNDDNVYFMKNGEWQPVTIVDQPSEWVPDIDDTQEIVITFDEDMTPYQLTGKNIGGTAWESETSEE